MLEAARRVDRSSVMLRAESAVQCGWSENAGSAAGSVQRFLGQSCTRDRMGQGTDAGGVDG